MKREGYGKDYRYAHNDAQNRARQTHLPKPLIGKRFYHPKEIGLEKQIKEKLDLPNPDFE
jgi:putative ATPase